jgi:hypothetical protein
MLPRSNIRTGAVLAFVVLPSMAQAEVNASLFGKNALVREPTFVDCTVTKGAAAKPIELAVKYKPDNLTIGAFCPTTLEGNADIWSWDGDKPGLYRLNRAFF